MTPCAACGGTLSVDETAVYKRREGGMEWQHVGCWLKRSLLRGAEAPPPQVRVDAELCARVGLNPEDLDAVADAAFDDERVRRVFTVLAARLDARGSVAHLEARAIIRSVLA